MTAEEELLPTSVKWMVLERLVGGGGDDGVARVIKFHQRISI